MTQLARWWVVGVAVLAVSCGPREPAGTLVNMYDNQFSGSVSRVPVGTRVTFLNQGRSVHNATSVDGAWKTGDVAGRSGGDGRGGDVVFDRPGVYQYYCTYHGTKAGGGMTGVVVVGDVPFSPSAKGAIASVDLPSGRTLKVPAEYRTIQSAVDAASPGDLVLVGRGVYREEVAVTTPSIVIRGENRNETIIDGEFVRGNGISVLADGVAVENMTARNAVLNGFFWTGVTGFRGSYLTAVNNGDYGIYAFGSSDGVFEASYASGSPDSGFYIGQCYPCNTVIRNVIAEHNALGYSGTNAGGRLYVVSSIWRYNRAGLVPASLDIELEPPQREAVFASNLVMSNNNANAPAITINSVVLGNGILLAGTVHDTVERNVILDHDSHGVATVPFQDRNYYRATGNVVRNNIVLGSGRADLANSGPGGTGNCFAGNEHRSSVPFGLEVFRNCASAWMPWWSDWVPLGSILVRSAMASDVFPDSKTQPIPGPQPSMPGGSGAPVRIARHVFDSLHFDLAAAQLPAGTDSVLAAWRVSGRGMSRGGVLSRLGANSAFLAIPVVLLWWAARMVGGRRVPTRSRWRWVGVVVTGLGFVLVMTVASAWLYGRI